MMLEEDGAALMARRPGWRAALLCGAAAGVLGLAAARSAQADTPCVISGGGTVLTCAGDQSGGIAVTPPFLTLNVSNLTTPIAPAPGVDGISFLSDDAITIDSFTGLNGISVQGLGADGIVADSAVSGAVTIFHVGPITTTDGYGVFARGREDVSTTTVGPIRSGLDAIHVESVEGTSIVHFGSIESDSGYGIFGYATEGTVTLGGGGGIASELDAIRLDARSTVNQRLTLDWTGDLTSRSGYGVFAYASNGAITSNTAGDIDAERDGIFLDSRSSSDTSFYSHVGDIRSASGYGINVYSSNGAISGSTIGDIDARLDGIHLDSRTSTTPLTFSHDGSISSATGYGVYAYASNATIDARTSGDIVSELDGIFLDSRSSSTVLNLSHTGDITSRAGHGINLVSSNGPVNLAATGDIDADLAGVYINNVTGAYVTVVQNGDITTHTASDFDTPALLGGIYVNASVGVVDISGRGDIDSASNGIYARSSGSGTGVTINRSGDIRAAEIGIFAQATTGAVAVTNVGDVAGGAAGIYAYSSGDETDTIVNQTGDVVATGGSAFLPHNWGIPGDDTTAGGYGILGVSMDGDVSITSSGDITAPLAGIYAYSAGEGTSLTINQTGDIAATGGSAVMPHTVGTDGQTPVAAGYGIFAYHPDGTIAIASNGDIDAVREGIYAYTTADDTRSLTINHTGDITSSQRNGIFAFTSQASATVTNVGDIDAALSGIYVDSLVNVPVTVTQTGDVTARGGDGVHVESLFGEVETSVTGNVDATGYGILIASEGNQTLTIGGGTVTGGSGAAGVNMSGGQLSQLTNYGTIRNEDGIDGLAVTTNQADLTIDNYGVVIGDLDLALANNVFNNHQGAVFDAGASVDLGEGNLLSNDGIFSPGGQGRVLTTWLNGTFVNNPDGLFVVDVDMDGSTADLVEVNNEADLQGRLFVNLLSFDGTPQTFTILTTGETVTTQELTLAQPVLIGEITYPTDQQVDLTILGLDFNPSGLGGNPGAVGDHLTSAFYAGSPGLQPVFTALVGLTSTGAVDDALRQLTPDVVLSAKLADLYGGLDFADGLMSCKVAGGAATFGAEGQCAWARARYDRLDQDGSAEEPGFTQDTGELSAGAQFVAAGDWRFGFGFGAASVDLQSDGTNQQVDGTRIELGAVAKYVPGPWLFAAALSGTYGWYDSTRRVDFGGFDEEFSGSPEIGTLNGRLRAAYTAGGDSFYVRPQVDLNATLVRLSGFTESGGAGAMTFEGETDTIVSLAPAVELGAQADLGDGMLLRGFLRGGLAWFMDPELTVTGAFVDASSGADDVTLTTSPDDVLWTVSAGADLFTSGGITVRAAYDGKFGESTTDNAVSLKVSMDF